MREQRSNGYKKLLVLFCMGLLGVTKGYAEEIKTPKATSAMVVNNSTIDIILDNNQRMTFDFYADNIVRLFQDNSGNILRDPEAKPDAKILVSNPRRPISKISIQERSDSIFINNSAITIAMAKSNTLFKVINKANNKTAIESTAPIRFNDRNVQLSLKTHELEYFFGGGVQNGRFSHKGKKIAIENQNSWTDGGVASPTPFYWSTNGYGVMWYTFKKGTYDFGSTEKNQVTLEHQSSYLDLFLMVNEGMIPLLNDFYQLTGNPVLIPKFGFYQGHLNAYNRDFWKEDEKGILFEDGKRYKESQKDNGGIKESLNGEKNNYQFSARAVIDRYKNHDMPFGWLLPNDGYGAGYGQTESLDGNIQNLKSLTDYANKNGVEIGLWTQSDLHPKAGISPLLQRDIVKEVRDAGVRVLKTDVAWVGAGYSFGLNGITDVAQIMTYYGNESRPFIISLDGWAGTQRYATVWSGDQSGGNWEYIRFHIPTYIGSGLSGQPNITSDMDGIFGGKNLVVNTRDFQWKTFTPMQLNMDGWGSNEKYPHALGEPATSINRNYLKLKSELMPYAYSVAQEAINGNPMLRAMFIEEPNAYTLSKATEYQFLYGPSFLVAPIYKETATDEKGNDIRDGIYLPKGEWIDYFTGDLYHGTAVINNFDAPLWKLPVLVKAGAIIPLTNPNNNVSEIDTQHRIYEFYPAGYSSFLEYDDDGITTAYLKGESTTTYIESTLNNKQEAILTIHPTKGDFTGFNSQKSTELKVNITKSPKSIKVKVGNKSVKLTEVNSIEAYQASEDCYFLDQQPNLNRFSTKGTPQANFIATKNSQLLIKLATTDTKTNAIVATIKGYEYAPINKLKVSTGNITAPIATVTDENTEAYQVKPTWNKVENADYYEIEFNGLLYTTIKNCELAFDNLTPETNYNFKIRSINKDHASDWSAFSVTTKSNPLEFAINGIEATIDVEDQGGSRVNKLFDFDESNNWHTKWGQSAMPLTIIADLKTINQIDKLHYLPRDGAGNGTLLKGSIYHSADKKNWTKVEDYEWERNDETKVVIFKDKPTARFIKITATEATGNFGSGKEIYIFKVPNTESYIPGDINHDWLINENDLTSYTNYTGLRMGDADFEGYISKGDINLNNLIDAYDISVLTTQLRGGIKSPKSDGIAGSITVGPTKKAYKKGEIVEIKVSSQGFKNINAMSFALPYDETKLKYEGIEVFQMGQTENLTNDRLHTFGVKSLYPTFVNIGEQEELNGSKHLFTIKFRALENYTYNLKATDILLVNRNLNFIEQE